MWDFPLQRCWRSTMRSCAVDMIPAKVDLINRRKSPIQDEYIEKYLAEKELKLTATLDAGAGVQRTRTLSSSPRPQTTTAAASFFDTSAVEAVIQLGHAVQPQRHHGHQVDDSRGLHGVGARKVSAASNIIFSPEFLRESKALYDNLYPSRIIVGTDLNDPRLVEAAHTFAGLLQEGAIKENIDTLFMGFTEAEAVKLFANTYLALRVAYFNELDTYAEMQGSEYPADHRRRLP